MIKTNQPTFIDLFAGASGMSEGFIKAGFTPIAHIEMNTDACYTIKTRAAYHYLKSNKNLNLYYEYIKGNITRNNFYEQIPKDILNSVINVEITDNSIKDIFENITSKNQSVDIIIGGPPCQAYSLLGRHKENMENDPRNKLYIQYGRFLKKYNPKAFVFENVPGLLSANKGQHFKNLKAYFRKLGYEVYHETLDASDYGVVQARKRIIIVGWKKEINLGFPDFKKTIKKHSVNDAFSDLPQLYPGEGFKYIKYISERNNYLKTSGIRNGIDFVTQHISRPHNERDLAIYKIAIQKWNHEKIRLKYPDLPEELKNHKNESSFIDRFKVVDGSSVSHTVVAHIAKDGHYYIHPDENQCRSISVREAARLQSFPDDFYFEGSRSAAFKQIGNAVPPLMAYAIAKKMKEIYEQL
ncbi:DNA (cytosine-5-)-methyltransferase [Chryseobacterium bernardetii]|uniref:Cytosine-specific methyltransferase n=1 Tax=Chryseobacterium bernardetii TaxID=1241978 RepID=A0A3G6TH91_9FLAO|nr:DNA (cytosine-5-)-methyltransferase [Chryseobacterium bernardetii]AZB25440.1 DNA (cytosine-5-)-methyltransferase [Chryseobacterium bernardetii]